MNSCTLENKANRKVANAVCREGDGEDRVEVF